MESSIQTDTESAKQFMRIYDELRRRAAIEMRRMPGDSTLQPTALVHEVWLNLEREDPRHWQSAAHYLATAIVTMRRMLIDRARKRSAIRHGGSQQREPIDKIQVPVDTENDDRLLIIDQALDELAKISPQAANVAVMRLFGGLAVEEAAYLLRIHRKTAHDRWVYAVAWLYDQLNPMGCRSNVDWN